MVSSTSQRHAHPQPSRSPYAPQPSPAPHPDPDPGLQATHFPTRAGGAWRDPVKAALDSKSRALLPQGSLQLVRRAALATDATAAPRHARTAPHMSRARVWLGGCIMR